MYKVANKARVIEGLSPDTIPDEVFVSKEPIVLKGLVNHWPLVVAGKRSASEAIALIKTFYSGKPAPVCFAEPSKTGALAYNDDVSDLNFKTNRVDLSEVLDAILENSTLDNPPVRYIPSNIADIFFPGLRNNHDISFDRNCFVGNSLGSGDPLYGIWIGNKTTAPCHFDAQDNLACCTVGTRRFTLFPPNQIANLYPGPLDLTPGGPAITMVDFENPDFNKYPRFSSAIETGQLAELEAGDALFIPCMWWHHVEALSPVNVLIQYWWNTFPKIQGQAINSFELALLSIRDRPHEEKMAWKYIFDYYIFGDPSVPRKHLPEHAWGALGDIDEKAARQMRAKIINKLNR